MQPHLFLDTPWYWYSRRYPGAKAAWEAWQDLEEKVSGKKLDLGIYRHGPSDFPGQFVTVVSLQPQGVLRARRILRDRGGREVALGDEWLTEIELEALIARRVRAVHELLQKHPGESGSEILHHLGHGRPINPDGTNR